MTEKEQLQETDLAHLWHPFTQMSELKRKGSKIIVKGRGSIVWDINGNQYIDAAATLSANIVGHGRQEMLDAILSQMRKLEYISLFDYCSTKPAIELASRLAEIAPGDLTYVQFGCSGSDAVEIALKIARQYQTKVKSPRCYKVIARRDSFHGVTMGALSANGVTEFREAFEPLVPGFRHIPPVDCYHCPFGKKYPHCDVACAVALEEQILFEGAETVAAFIAEPICVAKGVKIPPEEYFPKIRNICDRYKVLFIADEIVTGFGRTGRFFASGNRAAPDIMIVGKGLASGYIPISAVVVRPKIYESFLGSREEAFLHGQTYQGHPLGCVASLKNIEIIEKEALVKKAKEAGQYFNEQLKGLMHHEIVERTLGESMLQSVELVDKKTHGEIPYDVGVKIRERIYDLGCICRFERNSLIMYPPLVISLEEIDKIIGILDRVFTEIEKDRL